MTTKFYQYRQNNSGGKFEYDKHDGISVFVIVEAHNYREANSRANNIGLYFNGCADGYDCPCCGDRWYEQWENDGDDYPMCYNSPIVNGAVNLGYVSNYGMQYYGFVHYLDDTVVPFRLAGDN